MWLSRPDTVKFCQDQGILVEAYSPLARAEKINNPVLIQITSELDATPVQVMIAWRGLFRCPSR
jgi:diketogulonate reductase-like aldo/keto reductase